MILLTEEKNGTLYKTRRLVVGFIILKVGLALWFLDAYAFSGLMVGSGLSLIVRS